MSRAMNISLPAADVLAMCAKHNASVSAIEALPNGATRVVLVNGDGAAVMRKAFCASMLPERTEQFPVFDHRRYLSTASRTSP